MARAAVIVREAGYDVIDLNFACPVKKIKNKARGGHMLMDVPRAKSILLAVRAVVPTMTVSLRRSYDDSVAAQDWFDELIDFIWSIDAAAVRVHGRTVEQKYLGRARWPFLAELKRRYPTRTILGSGDVFTAEDAVRMLRETGVDIVWIARGAIGNPWIFQNAATLLAGGEIDPPTIAQQRDALEEHFSLAMQLHGESLAGRRMRKMGIKYSRFHPHSAEVKKDFVAVHSLRDWSAVIARWYAGDGNGVWPALAAVDEVNV